MTAHQTAPTPEQTAPMLLKRVSRSFYLSLRVLPAPVRHQMGLAYLVARAADTIADTPVLPPQQRRDLLLLLLDAVQGEQPAALISRLEPLLRQQHATDHPAERQLLAQLGPCLEALRELSIGDQHLVQRVLGQLVQGMERDLTRFPAAPGSGETVPPQQVVALQTLSDLDEYTYHAAGCVGEFWTDLCVAHLPQLAALRDAGLRRRGVNLGHALQLVNVIRDVPQDLRAGRCYWPADVLRQCGVTPEQLAELARPETAPPAAGPLREGLLAVTRELCRMARELFQSAWPYVQAIPAREPRLRLACTWPLRIGLDTLAAVEAVGSPLLVPGRVVKVRRGQVYGLLARSSAVALGDYVWG